MDGSGGSAPRRYRVAIYCDRLGRGEKRYQVGNFVGRDHSLCEIGSGQPTFDLIRGDALRPGLPFDELIGLFGARTTRVYADHRDSGRRKFVREVLRQRGDADVTDRADGGTSVERGETGDVNNAPSSPCRHVGRHLTDGAQIAQHFDIHVGEKRLVGDLGERRRLALAAHSGGAVDENIDTTELAECLCYASLDGGIIAGVGDESLHTTIRCSRDFRGGGLKCGAIPRNQGDIHTLLCKLPGDSLPDAAVAASDDGDLIPKFQIQCALLVAQLHRDPDRAPHGFQRRL